METILEVLICAYGADGIRRVAEAAHPAVEGVRYLVSWQMPEGPAEIPAELSRPDFSVHRSQTRGLSLNRNLALGLSGAPLLLIADDDLVYTRQGLEDVIQAFESNPDADLLAFRYGDADGRFRKPYPAAVTDLRSMPRGWYPSSVEMALRASRVRGHFRFNENFGAGREFFCGEEELFLHDILKAGLCGCFVPLTVCRHPGPTTQGRVDPLSLARVKGAVFVRLHPLSWPLRMILHSARSKGSKIAYLRAWLSGVGAALTRNL